MPFKAKKECSWPGCHATTTGKYCAKHEAMSKAKQRTRNNSPQNKLYRSTRWLAQRKRVIKKAKGKCAECGVVVPEKERHVDHIEAVQDTGKFWVRDDELQLLCRSCHSAKTMEEMRKRGEV